VLIEGDDILGDGVNVAARLEAIAEAGGICISEDVYRHIQGKVEIGFSDMGFHQLKNIARPVRVYRALLEPVMPSRSPDLALPDRPSIAVLPFQDMSGHPEQEYFADGVVEDIISALSRMRWLFVIARNSSFTYKGRAVDVKQVGRELGARYVLEGSVRKAANRVRITGQLVDAATGAHLWADRFDGGLGDIFDLQDQVTESVVGAIAPAMEKAEIERAKRKPTESLDAYAFYLRGWPSIISLLTGRRSRRHCACSTAQSSSTQILRPPTVVPPLATPKPRPVAGFQTQRTRLPKSRDSLSGRLSWARMTRTRSPTAGGRWLWLFAIWG
jgi:TolB-like protein